MNTAHLSVHSTFIKSKTDKVDGKATSKKENDEKEHDKNNLAKRETEEEHKAIPLNLKIGKNINNMDNIIQDANKEHEEKSIVKRESDEDYAQAMEEIDDKKRLCKNLEYGSHISNLAGNILGDIPNANKTAAGFAMLSHAVEFGFDITSTTLECDDVNFDEIKLIMNKRFNDIDRKLDRQIGILEDVSRKVDKILVNVDVLQNQMNRGFQTVLHSMKNQEVYKIINKINTFVRSFQVKRDSLEGKRKVEYISELSRKNGILSDFEKYTEPVNSLYSALYELIDVNNHYSIPRNANDDTAFQALYALIYGTQTYALIMFYVAKQHFYLTNTYYEEGKFEDFNTQYRTMKSVYSKFQNSLIKGNKSLMDEVIGIMNEVKQKYFINDVKNEWYRYVSNIDLLTVKENIETIDLNMIVDVEDIMEVKDIDFAKPYITPKYGVWEDRSSVKYAVQLRENGIYSVFGSWSKEEIIGDKANPVITVPEDDNLRERLLFRKFDRGAPEFIGIMKNKEKKFRDINRDLYNAAGRGDQEAAYNITKMLIKNNADVSATFDQERNSLHAAALAGNDVVAKDLLLGKLDANIQDKNGYTAMHLAADSDQTNFIRLLIDNKADVNVHTTVDELTPLHIAAKNDYLDTVKEIMSSPGLKINEPDIYGFTALHYATHKRGNSRIVTELVKSDTINLSAKTKFGLTPFHLAAMNGFPEVVEAFYSNAKFEDINETSDDGMTALHYAAMFEKNVVVEKLLLKDNIAINHKATKNEWTPLHVAIYFKNENAAIQLLKDSRIDIHANGNRNITALHLSIASGESMYNVFKRLLDKHAKIEARTGEGFTPLHIAAMQAYPDFTSKLLEEKAVKDALSEDRSTPLHFATKFRRLKSVSKLLENKANFTISNNQNILPIHYAVMQLDFDMIKEFKKYDSRIILDRSQDLLDEVAFRIIYHYCKYKDSLEYAMYRQLSQLEIFQELKLYSLYQTLFPENYNVNNHSIYYVFEKEVQPCLEKESKNDSSIYCLYEGFIPSDSADKSKFMMTLPYKATHRNRLGRSIQNSNNFASEFLDLSGERYADFNAKGYASQNVDANGLLLLLNIIVRKFTDDKFHDYSTGEVPALEARAQSLDIIEKFGNLIQTVSNTEVDDLIDLSEVHSKVSKAIQSGNEHMVPKILCAYGEGLIDQEKVRNVFLPSNEMHYQRRRIENSARLFHNSCATETIPNIENDFGNLLL